MGEASKPQIQQQQQQQQQGIAPTSGSIVAIGVTPAATAVAAAGVPQPAPSPAVPALRPAAAVLTAKRLASLPDLVELAGVVAEVDSVHSSRLQHKRVQLLEFIGVGGSCTVYKGLLLPPDGTATAAPPRKQVFVAVMVYCVPSGDPVSCAMLQHATDSELWLLKHMAQPVGDTPSIVQLYGTGVLHIGSSSSSGSSDGSSSSSHSFRFAVLELGQSLYGHLSRTGPAPPKTIKLVMWQLVHAVSLLHNDPFFMIIHRDIKPDNILLLPSRRKGELKVKLMDFNVIAVVERPQLGSSAGGGSSSSNSSSHGLPQSLQRGDTNSLPLCSVLGSDLFMAPEVAALFDADDAGGAAAAAELPGYNEKVDVFGVGVVAFVMAAGGEGRLRQLMVPPAGVGRRQHVAGLVSRFAAGELLVGNMTADNMQEYEGLRQFVGACCAHDPAQRPSIADLKRPGVAPAWMHEVV
jgi:serine/threonine protein kinase